MYLNNGYLHKYTPEIIEGVRQGRSKEELGLSDKEYDYIKRYYIKGNKPLKGNKATGKTGRHSWHSKPLGSERAIKDGYIVVKIAYPRVERLKHHLEWEKYNPPIDIRRECLMFLDGDKTNCSIDNLVKVSKHLISPLNKLCGTLTTPEQRLTAIKAVELYCEAHIKAKQEKTKSSRSHPRQECKLKYKKVCELLEQGFTQRQIMEIMGVTPSVVKYAKQQRWWGVLDD